MSKEQLEKWEYKYVTLKHNFFPAIEESLNMYGDSGWELVNFVVHTNSDGEQFLRLIFKRKIKVKNIKKPAYTFIIN